MKKIYFIRDAKAENFSEGINDFERALRKKGLQDIETIGSYMALQNISFDLILCSYALRAQQTAIGLAEKLSFYGEQHFLEELYFSTYEKVLNIITVQDNSCDSICIVGHNPQLNELINRLSEEYISKVPSMGVVALEFDIEKWSEIEESRGRLDFFIYPKQFKYYMPKQIRSTLPR